MKSILDQLGWLRWPAAIVAVCALGFGCNGTGTPQTALNFPSDINSPPQPSLDPFGAGQVINETGMSSGNFAGGLDGANALSHNSLAQDGTVKPIESAALADTSPAFGAQTAGAQAVSPNAGPNYGGGPGNSVASGSGSGGAASLADRASQSPTAAVTTDGTSPAGAAGAGDASLVGNAQGAAGGAYSAGAGGAVRAALGSFGSGLASLFGEGDSGAGASGGVKGVDLGRTPADADGALTTVSGDPANYFELLNPSDNLFKIVERRYIAKTKQWALYDTHRIAQEVLRR